MTCYLVEVIYDPDFRSYHVLHSGSEDECLKAATILRTSHTHIMGIVEGKFFAVKDARELVYLILTEIFKEIVEFSADRANWHEHLTNQLDKIAEIVDPLDAELVVDKGQLSAEVESIEHFLSKEDLQYLLDLWKL